jgi:iron complex outermembrane receptor protein
MLGDVLRTLPSFYVTYDRNYSYAKLGAGHYNLRPAADRRRSITTMSTTALTSREFPLTSIMKVEVSRGPGASAYGNNAFFAVVNVVTKRGGDLSGFRLSAQAASFETYDARVSYGRKLADGSELLASTSVLDSPGQRLCFPEFAGEAGGGCLASGTDRERARRSLASYSRVGWARRRARQPREGHSDGLLRHRLRRHPQPNHGHVVARIGATLSWPRRRSKHAATFGAYDYKGAPLRWSR